MLREMNFEGMGKLESSIKAPLLCTLCFIVFIASLVVQDARAESMSIEDVPKQWFCTEEGQTALKIKLSFTNSLDQVSFVFKGAGGEWYKPVVYPVTFDTRYARVYWHSAFNGSSTYLTGLSIRTGRMEEFTLWRMMSDTFGDKLIRAGRILYDCVSDN